MTKLLAELETVRDRHAPRIFDDARTISAKSGSYDLVLTSPPYVGAQKYIRASSLGLGWLGLTPGRDPRSLERKSIGREHLDQSELALENEFSSEKAARALRRIENLNPVRAEIARIYMREGVEYGEQVAKYLRRSGVSIYYYSLFACTAGLAMEMRRASGFESAPSPRSPAIMASKRTVPDPQKGSSTEPPVGATVSHRKKK
jgi:hypothetical protein